MPTHSTQITRCCHLGFALWSPGPQRTDTSSPLSLLQFVQPMLPVAGNNPDVLDGDVANTWYLALYAGTSCKLCYLLFFSSYYLVTYFMHLHFLCPGLVLLSWCHMVDCILYVLCFKPILQSCKPNCPPGTLIKTLNLEQRHPQANRVLFIATGKP